MTAFTARGGNQSAIHLDFMVGSGEIDIDGIAADGTREPLMRQGEWADWVTNDELRVTSGQNALHSSLVIRHS